jgi:hypothetical protein
MKAIAEQVLRVLKGEPADTIPLSRPDLSSAARLASTQAVGHRRSSHPRERSCGIAISRPGIATRVYRRRGGVVLAQAALIAGLLLRLTGRRQAESAAFEPGTAS